MTGNLAPARTNAIASSGFFLYCLYLLSGVANDWSLILFGGKAYLSTITLLLLPLAWLLSGRAARGLQHRIGWWWLAFAAWLALATPFSVWRGGSAQMLFNYLPKSYLCYFYTCSFVTSLKRCRLLMLVNALGAGLLLLTCLAFGQAGEVSPSGRFEIPGSLFYANSNDLALALLEGIAAFLFLFFTNNIAARFLATLSIALSAFYTLRTGSRGCLLAGIALLGMVLLLSRNRWKAGILTLPILGLALLDLPGETVHRLSTVLARSDFAPSNTIEDQASQASAVQREGLLKKSLEYTLAHPLFGVGPDQFAAAVFGDAARSGEHVVWLGTHNSYTQVSSECGIPALIFYCAAILLCFRSNYRLYRRAQRNHRETAGLSFCLLAATLVYALSTFFFHIAYSMELPLLAGFSAALALAAGREAPSLP